MPWILLITAAALLWLLLALLKAASEGILPSSTFGEEEMKLPASKHRTNQP